ncbi:MAG: hypothetical protein WCX08_03045 [Candidatus Buchananbacteria bacterium]|jgi:hypothetical protein
MNRIKGENFPAILSKDVDRSEIKGEIGFSQGSVSEKMRKTPGYKLLEVMANFFITLGKDGKFQTGLPPEFSSMSDEHPFHHYVSSFDSSTVAPPDRSAVCTPIWAEGQEFCCAVMAAKEAQLKMVENGNRLSLIVDVAGDDYVTHYIFEINSDGSRPDCVVTSGHVKNSIAADKSNLPRLE